MRNSERLTCSTGILLYTYHIHNNADTASAITVVVAEQTIPNPSPPINIRSSTAFNIAAKAKNRRGVLESPMLLRAAAIDS